MPGKPGRSFDEFADERKKAAFEEHEDLLRKNRTLTAAVRERDAELESLRSRLDLVETLEAAKVRPPRWLAPKRPPKGEHVGIPSLLLTDVHREEVVRPEEIDYINAHNLAISDLRLKRVFTSAITVTRTYWAGVKYEGFQLFLGGDLLAGIIHEELKETNEDTVVAAILSLLDPLEAGIALLADEFGRVNINAVVGNHGRHTRKPRAKHRARDSFDWLVYKLIQRDFANDDRITIDVADAADDHVTIYNTRYLLTHGDQFRGGTGISAELAPLMLGVHRKAQRQVAAGKPFDVMVMGHWHKTIWLPAYGLIVGGSVVGYSEHDYTKNYKVEPPQQSLWLTTPERGITLAAPVFASKREEEGW